LASGIPQALSGGLGLQWLAGYALFGPKLGLVRHMSWGGAKL